MVGVITDQQKAKMIEKHRDINVHDDWYDGVYDQHRGILANVGITEPNFQFTGFWSQGNGASFTGRVYLHDFVGQHPALIEQFPATWKLLNHDTSAMWAVLTRRGREVHECSVSLDADYDIVDNLLCGEPVKDAVVRAIHEAMEGENDGCAFDEAVLTLCRDYMQALYADLEAEYESLCSDEAVWESIEANDLDEVDEDDEDDDDDISERHTA